ncbi:hypothetical protein BUALT_Bualt06G0137700 [Buddleja alternifolia]|uniref:Uncharacterized protein n=1 Tax=Buddleja alternifolia TaxID=168488 RepID=A0AAV6XGF5_9LAMI|nr:hypothetical protein BUALT_Bualt06G0137700 [Buddleja alternifolia]
MGEVLVSSEGGERMTVDGGAPAAAAAAAADSTVVEWERFLPKMVLRVLLVEADDSTRQIISALLRKCSYKVAAVADGLKAWELMKGNPHNIDLILTEVELPSISGYALLTLIMEHDVCKKIPVIMMSSQDSISTVYKCMLRGATDFLVKPLRKNELRNLWQHVWRKQVSSTGAGLGPPDETVPQQKVEGSETQSSCTKPESQSEGTDIEHIHSFSQPNNDKCLSDNSNIPTQEQCYQESRETPARDNETGESRGQDKIPCDAENEDDHVHDNSSREAIDLIGAVDNYLKGTFGSAASNVSTNKFDILLQLDLSLRRSHPIGSVNQVNDERCINHSDASPFSRYVNKPLHPCNQHKERETEPQNQFSNYTPDYNSETLRQPDITFSYPQKGDISLPIPVRGVRFENVINNPYCSLMHHTQSSLSPLPSPGAAHHTESFPPSDHPFYQSDHHPENSQQFHDLMDQRISNAMDHIDDKQGQKLESADDRGNDQSGNSNFCIGKIDEISTAKAASECGNEEGSHRSIREAALMKFRLKRKDRCFEKKVRYESRKKLAEQRPRVKGQFVRQAPNDCQPEDSSAG